MAALPFSFSPTTAAAVLRTELTELPTMSANLQDCDGSARAAASGLAKREDYSVSRLVATMLIEKRSVVDTSSSLLSSSIDPEE